MRTKELPSSRQIPLPLESQQALAAPREGRSGGVGPPQETGAT